MAANSTVKRPQAGGTLHQPQPQQLLTKARRLEQTQASVGGALFASVARRTLRADAQKVALLLRFPPLAHS